MPSGRRHLRRSLVGVALLAALPLLLLAHPRARASLRWVSGFHPLERDPRIYLEPGAEALAERIADALPDAVAKVEAGHALPFRSGFRVYVCSSHESFTRRIGHPVSSPVRGIAFPWDIWVSPNAFAFYGRDTHRQTLAHELSHLHLGQYLGWWHRVQEVPTWFAEGLADGIADTGGERVSRREAMEALVHGRRLVPDASGRLPFPKQPQDYGLSWPMFHMQSRMLVEYLRGRDEATFRRFMVEMLAGRGFEEAFRRHFGDTPMGSWKELLDSLRSELESATPPGGPPAVGPRGGPEPVG